MLPNIMSLEDHVKKINLAKSRVKNSIFEMAEAITNAVFQLEDRQKDLAEQLGMSRGTLSNGLQ
jgi:DNA-binding MarR family transcriptional regulator